MRIEYHFEAGGFSALKPEWNELLHRSRSDTLFLTWEWQSTWWQHLGEGELVLLGFRGDDGRLVGLAPLYAVQHDDGQTVLNEVGCRDVSDYLDLIVERGQEDAVYGALLDYLDGDSQDWQKKVLQSSLVHDRFLVIRRYRGRAFHYTKSVPNRFFSPQRRQSLAGPNKAGSSARQAQQKRDTCRLFGLTSGSDLSHRPIPAKHSSLLPAEDEDCNHRGDYDLDDQCRKRNPE